MAGERALMTKEVSHTTVKLAKMEIQNGLPVAIALPDVEFYGKFTLEQAQKKVNKELKERATVVQVLPKSITYEATVDEFIAIAHVKEPKVETETAATDDGTIKVKVG